MKDAFCYMFRDNKIKEKMALYFCIAFISNVCSNIAQLFTKDINGAPDAKIIALIAAGLLVGLVTTGYSIACNRAIIEQRENVVLPFINFWRNMFTGFKFGVSIMLMIAVFTLMMIPFAFLSAVFSPLIINLYIVAFVIFVACVGTALTYIFAVTDSWISFLKFKTAFKMIANSKWQYWSRVLLIVVIGILNSVVVSLISSIAGNTIIGTVCGTALTCVLGSYLVYVFAHFVANSVNPENV